MQITLNQDEIVSAIEEYVRKQIVIAKTQQIEIDLKAGRGENGFTATLDIRPASTGTTRISASAITRAVEIASQEAPAVEEVVAEEEDADPAAAVDSANEESDEDVPPAVKPTSIFNFAKPAE